MSYTFNKDTRKREPNNHNVKWIVVETIEEDGKNINIITRGVTKTGVDETEQNHEQHQWVRKNTTPQQQFDARKENDTFNETILEILKENIASTSGTKLGDDVSVYDMPRLFDQTNKDQSS